LLTPRVFWRENMIIYHLPKISLTAYVDSGTSLPLLFVLFSTLIGFINFFRKKTKDMHQVTD